MDSKPVYVFRELMHYLATHRIISPAYRVIQDTVGKALTAEQNRLTAMLRRYLGASETHALQILLEDAPGLSEITRLKREPRDFSAREMAREIGRGHQIHELYALAKGIATSLNDLGWVAWRQGDYDAARTWSHESLTLWRELGDSQGIATSLTNLGWTAHHQGDYATACRLHQESLTLRRERGDKRGMAFSLTLLGWAVSRQGDYVNAAALLEEARAVFLEVGMSSSSPLRPAFWQKSCTPRMTRSRLRHS